MGPVILTQGESNPPVLTPLTPALLPVPGARRVSKCLGDRHLRVARHAPGAPGLGPELLGLLLRGLQLS